MMTTEAIAKATTARETLRRIGARQGVIQIVPPRNVMRPNFLRDEDDHDGFGKALVENGYLDLVGAEPGDIQDVDGSRIP